MEDRHAHGNGMRGRGTPTPVVRRSHAAVKKPRTPILGTTNIKGGKIRLDPGVDLAVEPQKKIRRKRLLRIRKQPKQANQYLVSSKQWARHARISLWPKARRTGTIVLALYMGLVSAGTVQLLSQQLNHASYTLDAKSTKLIGKSPSDFLAKKLTYDTQQQQYLFNPNYKPDANAVSVGEGQFSAALGQDLRQKGFSITDPASQISVTLTPDFNSLPGQQQNGRVVYPLYDGSQVVYTVRSNGLKEDIVLPEYGGDTRAFSYTLSLPTGLEARMLSNGGIGIYSADPSLFGTISYGSDKDKALVEKARAHGKKTNLVFGIPAPEITEQSGTSKATAKFVLKGNKLTVQASNLKRASYPLSIDPSVVDASATTFAGGGAAPNVSSASNTDSNISFLDSSNNPTNPGGGSLTNGTINTFASAGTTTATNYFAASAVYGNTIYNLVPSASSTSATAVYYATISSSGTIGTWTATSSLSSAANVTEAVIVNGNLYAVGGFTYGPNTPLTTVQYAPICTGVNVTTGLSTNCTTSSTVGTLGSWTTTTSMNTARSGGGVYAYNNHIYAFGGETAFSPVTVTNSVEYATLNTNGSIASWTNSGNSLPGNNMYFGYTGYNGYVYAIGGTSDGGTTLLSTSYYAKLLPNGTIGPWISTTALPATTYGLTAAITNGYIYAMGGVQTFHGAVVATTYYAPVNADGSIGLWNTTTSESTGLAFSTAVLFNNAVFNLAGCTSYNCGTFTNVIPRAVPNTGAAANLLATRQTGTAFPTETTNGGTPEGKFAHGSAVLNGYLYVIGGCIVFNGDETCATNRGLTIASITSQVVDYAPINADGTIGSWSATTSIPPGNGLAAFGLVAFHNSLVVVGGVTIFEALGINTNWQTQAYYSTFNPATGASNGWTTVNNILPQLGGQGYGYMSAQYINGNIYIAGGCNSSSNAGALSCNTYTSTVCRIPVSATDTITAGGGTGTPSCVTTGQTSLATVIGSNTTLFGTSPTGISQMGTAYGGGYLYLMGGATSVRSQLRTIVYAQVDAVNGITGAWHIATATILYSTNGGTATSDGVRDVSAAYANGQLLAFGGYNGNGSLSISSIISVCAITPSTGDVASCTASGTALSATRWSTAAAYGNGYFYDTGGCTAGPGDNGCSNISNAVDIYRMNYGGPGVANAWTTGSSSMGTARYIPAMAASNGHLYLIGGCTDTSGACTTPVTTVMVGTISGAADSSRVTWASSTSLPLARGGMGAVIENGYLYALGGYNGGSVSNYYYAKLANDGSITTNGVTGCSGGAATWCSASMPANIAVFGSTTANGKIYVGGGLNSAGTQVATVYIGTPSLSDGSISWTSGTSFTTGRQDLGMVAYGGNLYIAGGQATGGVYLQDIQFAPITSTTTGAIGSWTYTGNLPLYMQSFNMFAENGYLIVVGGIQTGGTCNNGTWTGSIASNGQVAPMQKNFNAFSTAASWGGAAYYDGYLYQAGGICGATDNNNTVYAGFAAQPAISQFSQLVDAGANVSPVNMYINTSRGSISSRVTVLYSSATGPGPSAFGNNQFLSDMMDAANSVYPISAIDGSGTTIDTNRFYYLFFTLDDSQSVSFPAATQVTSMSRYELFYHPNSGLRLRGGQTFSNGAATSLDAAPR